MWRVYNNLPTKLFLFKHRLLGPAVAWVPNFRTRPSTVNCALASLKTNESYHGCMQEQNWLLWEPPGRTWGSCRGGADICPQGGTGTWRFWEIDPDFHLTLLRFKQSCASANLLLYREIFIYMEIGGLKILILNVVLQKKSRHWWCFPGSLFPIYINIMPHMSVTFIQTYYSWVAKRCLCP